MFCRLRRLGSKTDQRGIEFRVLPCWPGPVSFKSPRRRNGTDVTQLSSIIWFSSCCLPVFNVFLCRSYGSKAGPSYPITIRIIAGVLFVVIVAIIVWRRKKMASKRKPLP